MTYGHFVWITWRSAWSSHKRNWILERLHKTIITESAQWCLNLFCCLYGSLRRPQHSAPDCVSISEEGAYLNALPLLVENVNRRRESHHKRRITVCSVFAHSVSQRTSKTSAHLHIISLSLYIYICIYIYIYI